MDFDGKDENKEISKQEAILILNRLREKITPPYVRAALRIGILELQTDEKTSTLKPPKVNIN